MRRVFFISICMFILVAAIHYSAVVGCGGSSGGGGDDGTTRTVTGTITSSTSANIISSVKAASDTDCSGITSVVAVTADGTSVTDDSFEDCSFSLPLTIGTAYMFEFRNPNKKSKSYSGGLTITQSSAILYPDGTEQFTASIDGTDTTDVTWKLIDGEVDGILRTDAGSKFTIEDGTEDIPLGAVTVSNGSANFNSDVVCNNPGNAKYILCENWTDTDPEEATGFGSVNSNGLYTAPSSLPESNHAILLATNASDSSVKGTADLFIIGEYTFSSATDIASSWGVSSFTNQIGMAEYDASVHLYGSYVSDKALYFFNSDDGGSSFSAPSEIAAATTDGNHTPTLAVDADGNIYITWVDDSEGVGDWNIYVSKSTDGGTSFSTPVKVNSNCATAANYQANDIAVDESGNIHLAFCCGDGDWSTYYSRSTDGGASFSSDVQMDSSTASGWCVGTSPKLGVGSDGNIYLVWANGVAASTCDYYIAHSADYGESFGDNVRINPTSGDAYNHGMSRGGVVVDVSGGVHALWNYKCAEDDSYLYVSSSDDDGATFGDGLQISQSSCSRILDRNLVIDESGVMNASWLVYDVGASESIGIYLSRSVDGLSWTDQALIPSSDGIDGYYFRSAVDASSNIYFLFTDGSSMYFVNGE
jgi:hypothetical protein